MLDPRPVLVGFMVDKVKIGQVFFTKYLSFPLSITISPMLNINILSFIYDSINQCVSVRDQPNIVKGSAKILTK